MSFSLLLGAFFAVLVSVAAYYARSLDLSGAIAATVVGTIIFGIGGWQWALILLIFFISSSALSKAFSKRKKGLDEKFSKGGRRDHAQVLGNGGLATLFALLYGFLPDQNILWLLFLAALAAVNADTWATEIGVLSSVRPRNLLDLRQVVEKGTSGGISVVGTLGSIAGALVIAIAGALVTWFSADKIGMIFWVTVAGTLGSFFDSWLGATVQAMYFCPSCEKETEKHPTHSCGTRTTHIKGFKWLNNDLVNFGCSALSVVTLAFIWLFM